MVKKKKTAFSFEKITDRHVYVILVVLAVLSRIPFLKTFELVAYDGTYYLNQARTIFSGHMAGSFPIGYPLVVRIFQIVLRDYQLTGMVVSFAASVGATIVAYLLAKHFVRRELALLAAVAVTLNPLFIRQSLMTLSESLYVFWVLLGLLMFVRERWLPFGLAMGAAAITRPEAIAIVGLLGLTRIRRPKQLALIAVSFLAVYAVNSTVLSVNLGRAVILPKSEFFGSSTAFWKLREASIDFENKEASFEELKSEAQPTNPWADYFKRLPFEVRLVVGHVLPVIFLLALFAFRYRKYWFLAAALVSFLVIPLATVRSMDRYILPYLPILILLAVFAVDGLRNRSLRSLAVGLIVASVVALPVLNKAALLTPEEIDATPMKKAGLEFRDDVAPGDKIADRKPYFSYYSGGKYVEIPVAPYEDVMTNLTGEEKVKYLALHYRTIHILRPALRPLMYSKAVINGELRYRQVYFDPDGMMVFQRVRDEDPLRWSRITPPGGDDFAPAWSPDGGRIAFRSRTGDGAVGIYVIESDGRTPRKVTDTSPILDQLTWSPDGRRIAFADGQADSADIYAVDVESGAVESLVTGPGNDLSPSWSPTGDEVVFSSDRTGQVEVWVLGLTSGNEHAVTSDGGNTCPVVSPSGEYIAWIKKNHGIVIMHGPTGRRIQFQAPKWVGYAPTWSPDEQYVAVTAEDWGNWDIYLMKSDGTNGLLLTKNPKRDAMPAWSPDGSRIVLVSDVGQADLSIRTIDGLGPYLERLKTKQNIQVFPPRAPR
jgi:TolB protein